MITLITGAPGSGKTLYTIDKLIRSLVGTTVKGQDEDGNPVVYNRDIYSNINGLQVDHVLIDGAWLERLNTEHKPGMVVVFDEVQRVWPNRPAGSKKSPAVEFLETHRHEGIDIIIMTQNPQLLDPSVRALVGRHLHMRRVASLSAAIVYEWDACSNALNYKNAFTKSLYRYSSSVYKLYRSAKVHTKPVRRLPAVVWGVVIGLVGVAYMWPTLMQRISAHGAPVTAVAPQSVAGALAPSRPVVAPVAGSPAAPVQPVSAVVPFAGCIVVKGLCECYDVSGKMVDGDHDGCVRARDGAGVRLTLGSGPVSGGRPGGDSIDDALLAQFVSARR